jgi:hypothetical protein
MDFLENIRFRKCFKSPIYIITKKFLDIRSFKIIQMCYRKRIKYKLNFQ